MQLGSHPVAVVQYTFTHKQYTERHKVDYIEQHKKKFRRMRAVPRLYGLYPGICLTTEEKARRNLIYNLMEHQFKKTWVIRSGPTLKHVMFLRNYKNKQMFVDRRCVCNPAA